MEKRSRNRKRPLPKSAEVNASITADEFGMSMNDPLSVPKEVFGTAVENVKKLIREQQMSEESASETVSEAIIPEPDINFETMLPGGSDETVETTVAAGTAMAGTGATVVGNIKDVVEESFFQKFIVKLKSIANINYMVPVAILLFSVMLVAMGNYVAGLRANADSLLRNGPAEAYQLAEAGKNDEARRLWVQINAQAPWYMPLAGIFTNIDEPYLQKASLAFKAEAWDDVVENAYKALNVPITDQQAVYIQQMILTATAQKVRAYLPNQEEQPIKGGIPEHAAPVCNPASPMIWVVPCVLLLVSAICLYGRMKMMFAVAALFMPLYFWGVSAWNSYATESCEARLSFNPSHIQLYDIANRMTAAAGGFSIVNGHPYGPLTTVPKEPITPIGSNQPKELSQVEIEMPSK